MTTPRTPAASPEAAARSIRVLVLSFAGAMAIVAVIAPVLLPPGEADQPPLLLLAGFAAVPLVSLALVHLIGYRADPLDRNDVVRDVADVQAASLRRFLPGHMLRMALAEAPLIALLALGFTLPYGPWPVLAAAGPAIAVLFFIAWPGRRTVRRVADQLEANGARSHLPEAFGHA
ncbi:hypothetical protein ACHAAC_10840 [Aeromicrobium sp. CF4.19]|uniref:hypothetical protein n=1 Tax=Aeromicrobium sp. CF4.19 TaxID=3373082 RepID=UPI003EE648DC